MYDGQFLAINNNDDLQDKITALKNSISSHKGNPFSRNYEKDTVNKAESQKIPFKNINCLKNTRFVNKGKTFSTAYQNLDLNITNLDKDGPSIADIP